MGYNTRVYCSKAQRWRRIDVNLMKGRRRPDSRRSIVTWICTQAPDQTCYFERVHGNNGQTYYFSEATYNTLSSRKKTEQCNLGALALPSIPRYLQKGAWAFNDLMATVMLKAEECFDAGVHGSSASQIREAGDGVPEAKRSRSVRLADGVMVAWTRSARYQTSHRQTLQPPRHLDGGTWYTVSTLDLWPPVHATGGELVSWEFDLHLYKSTSHSNGWITKRLCLKEFVRDKAIPLPKSVDRLYHETGKRPSPSAARPAPSRL
uniref:Uncharacterized protein n=1 Tax=Oryza nivara TaxID=4536 RepID=A0A0E0FVJ8_ORYNI